MIYTASDALDLAYRIIGKTSANFLGSEKYNNQQFRLLAMDLKELFRAAIKNKVKTPEEFDKLFGSFSWTFFVDESQKAAVLAKIYEFNKKILFKKDDANYWLDKSHTLEELRKLYDVSLENTFISDKEKIDWSKSVRIIEYRFLSFLSDKNFIFNETLKEKLREYVNLLNENEDVNSKYEQKYENSLDAIKKAEEFCIKYEQDDSFRENLNFKKDYESFKLVIDQVSLIDRGAKYDLSYEALVEMIEGIPEDITKLSIEDGQKILKRIFYASFLNLHITSGKTALLNSKTAFVAENGRYEIDLSKKELFNTYIALTQSKKVIEKEIKQDNYRFNDDISEVCLILIALSLKDLTPEKFVNIEDNVEYEVPNRKIVSVFIYELSQLIKYHETGGQTYNNSFEDDLITNSGEIPVGRARTRSSLANSKANSLLDFENISGVIAVLKSGHRDIQDYPDTVVMRTIKFIIKLSEIEVI